MIAVRLGIFPDPKVTGNAGSFFKSVFVKKEKVEEMLLMYPTMPYFEEDGITKIPAGWLVDQAGWKGKRIGSVGVHERHALILVNHGGATAAELLGLAGEIINSVKEKFDLELVPEVNLI